jgi:hypothetical protein
MTPLQYGREIFPLVTWFGVVLNLVLVPVFTVLAGIILYRRYVRGEEVAS